MKIYKALFILLFIPFIGLSQEKECEYDLLPTTYISYDSIINIDSLIESTNKYRFSITSLNIKHLKSSNNDGEKKSIKDDFNVTIKQIHSDGDSSMLYNHLRLINGIDDLEYDSIFFKRIGEDNKVWFIVYDDFNDVFNSMTDIIIFSLNGKTVCGQSMSYLCNVNEYLIKTLKQWSNIKEEEIQYLELLLSLFESYEY